MLGFFIVSAAFVNGFYKYLPVMFFVFLFLDAVDVAAYARGDASSGDTVGSRLEIEEAEHVARAR